MRALWQLNSYYLRVHKYKEAERDLRYLNDAATRNPSACPVSLSDIQKAYAIAVNGVRSGASISATSALKVPVTVSTTGGTGQSSAPGAAPAAVSSVGTGTGVWNPAGAGGGSISSGSASAAATTAGPTPAIAASPLASAPSWRASYTLPPQSWKLGATVPGEFEAGPVSGYPQSWFVRSKVFPATGFGNLVQPIDPQPFLGKRIKLSANIRTEDIVKAQLWLRLDDKKAGVMSADNMINRPIIGTTDWSRCECTLDVPRSTSLISAGLIITKGGQAWIKDAVIEEVSAFQQTTETHNTGN
jgi:hypothetical protein